MSKKDDLLLNAKEDVAIRQQLIKVALGQEGADLAIRVGRLFHAHTATWADDQEIIIKGRRIAWVGPAGEWTGTCANRVHEPDLTAVPGFGEVHKHIESTHLTPEYEAELVLPYGNTWTCEASHEFGNVAGSRNEEFWKAPRRKGSPLKIFIQPGSAVPPSAWEVTGGHYDYDDQYAAISRDMMTTALDEVMDWPAVTDEKNPGYGRLWNVIEATIAARGVVEGHGAGLTSFADCNAFAAAGLSSDHEVIFAEEALRKLNCGTFLEMKPNNSNFDRVLPGLVAAGLTDWSNVALTTDDRSASDTLDKGACDYNIRKAIELGVPVEAALQCGTLNPAKHMRIDPWVGSLTAGCYADVVLLRDVATVQVTRVYSDGVLVGSDHQYVGPRIEIDWPAWANDTIQLGGTMAASDFVIPAEEGRDTMDAALLRPFHWDQEYLTLKLPVEKGAVQRDPGNLVTKFAVVDRYSDKKNVSSMFWKGCGPADADTALACSVAHDSHNIWTTGSSDEAMALAVNTLAEINGGWALVHKGRLVATVRFEIGGLMTARPAEELDQEMKQFRKAAAAVNWMFEPTVLDDWKPGFPEILIFSTLTCAPWRWVLVAPHKDAPSGFVNVQTGETRPVVW